MSSKKFIEKLTKEVLVEYYINQKLSTRQIGKLLNVSQSSVIRYLKLHEIDARFSGHVPVPYGTKIGLWTVKHRVDNGNNDEIRYECECECGTVKTVAHCMFIRGASTNCGCDRNFTGYKDLSGKKVCAIKNSAKERNLDFNITKEQIWEIYERQDRKCAYTGLPVTFDRYDELNSTASVDRIDNDIGYVPENIQIVHKGINMLRNGTTHEAFIYVLKHGGNHLGTDISMYANKKLKLKNNNCLLQEITEQNVDCRVNAVKA